MSQHYSLEQIKEEFNLTSTEKDEIRVELKKLRQDFHPDKNGGEFKNAEVEFKFHRINEAINFIDNYSNSMIRIGELPALAKIFNDLTNIKKNDDAENIFEEKVERKIDANLAVAKDRIKLPRFGLAGLTFLLTGIVLFPKQLSDHPLLKHTLENEGNLFFLTLFWLSLVIITFFFWIITYINEEKQKNRVNNLKLEGTQNKIFELFIESTSKFSSQKQFSFSKDVLTDFILFYMSGTKFDPSEFHVKRERHKIRKSLSDSYILGGGVIDNELAQIISEKIISRGEKKGIIQKVTENKSLYDVYELKFSKEISEGIVKKQE
jgi:hypothetical protein